MAPLGDKEGAIISGVKVPMTAKSLLKRLIGAQFDLVDCPQGDQLIKKNRKDKGLKWVG